MQWVIVLRRYMVARATTLDVKEPVAPAHAAKPSAITESGRITHGPDLETARRLKDDLLRTYAERARKAVEVLEAGFDDAMAVMALPERYGKRLRTTNGVERLNQETRRRERVIRIFPNEDSALRLLGAVPDEDTLRSADTEVDVAPSEGP